MTRRNFFRSALACFGAMVLAPVRAVEPRDSSAHRHPRCNRYGCLYATPDGECLHCGRTWDDGGNVYC